jgi:predicted porin
LFGRRANVGVSGGFGTVTIGRNSSSYDDVSGDHAMMAQSIFDPSNTNNGRSTAEAAAELNAFRNLIAPGGQTAANTNAYLTAAVPFLANRNTTWLGFNTRFNNSIKYISPTFSGFSGSLMYALGEDKTTAVGASRTISANLKYANGPLLVSGGYQSEGAARTATTQPTLDNMLISASYDLGVAKIGAGYNVAKYKDILPGVSTDAQKEYNISVAVPLGATTISAGYARSKGNDFGTSTGFGIQAIYSLSKRTSLYAGAQSTKAYSDIKRVVNVVSPTSNIGDTQTYGVGVRHRF